MSGYDPPKQKKRRIVEEPPFSDPHSYFECAANILNVLLPYGGMDPTDICDDNKEVAEREDHAREMRRRVREERDRGSRAAHVVLSWLDSVGCSAGAAEERASGDVGGAFLGAESSAEAAAQQSDGADVGAALAWEEPRLTRRRRRKIPMGSWPLGSSVGGVDSRIEEQMQSRHSQKVEQSEDGET